MIGLRGSLNRFTCFEIGPLQDVHSGTVTQPSASTYGLYFSGHLIFKAILDALEATAGLGKATDIILTGGSAGGIGVWINVDFLAQRFPSAQVAAVPIAVSRSFVGIEGNSSLLRSSIAIVVLTRNGVPQQ